MDKQQLFCNANEPKEGEQGIMELCTTLAGGFGISLLTDSPKKLQKTAPPLLIAK